MKTIIVATDFSPAALNAGKYAADMALSIDADILLLHVYHMPVIYYEIPVAFPSVNLMEDAETHIAKMKNELSREKGRSLCIKTEVRMGNFFPELETVCSEVKPYAVVMGSQGTNAAERLFFGGHTISAMKNLLWPLITVPHYASYAAIRKIGLACDLEQVVDITPVEEIKILVNDFQAELHVLNTGKGTELATEASFQSALLEEMIGSLKPKYHFITSGKTDEGIMDFAEKNNIDLLVVLPKRHGLLNKIIHKSHTRRFVLLSHVPVMALHQNTL